MVTQPHVALALPRSRYMAARVRLQIGWIGFLLILREMVDRILSERGLLRDSVGSAIRRAELTLGKAYSWQSASLGPINVPRYRRTRVSDRELRNEASSA